MNVVWWCLSIGCSEKYLGLRGTEKQGNGENYRIKSLMIFTHHQNHSGDLIEKNEMSRVCNRYGGAKRCVRGFGGET